MVSGVPKFRRYASSPPDMETTNDETIDTNNNNIKTPFAKPKLDTLQHDLHKINTSLTPL